MHKCNKCHNEFCTPRAFTQHLTKNNNCKYRCNICLKYYASKRSLRRHEEIVCIPKYECKLCFKHYKSKKILRYHLCNPIEVSQIDQQPNNIKEDQLISFPTQNINENISNGFITKQTRDSLEMAKEFPDKQLLIINNINVTNTNNTNTNTNTNSNNSKKNISNKKVNNNNMAFLDTRPNWLDFGYDETKYRDYSKYNVAIDEEKADMFMYQERQFKEKYKEALVFFEKQNLELHGFKMLHDELQKDPKYRNVRIKKTKSGKCYIYNGEWKEVPLQKAITKICNKLCDSLYDKDTSVNHFLNLIIGYQSKRMMALRKHIEKNIINLNDLPLIDNEIDEAELQKLEE